jgi:hypothetical protein
MTTRERYYLNAHLDRLADWQTRKAQEHNRERIIRRREFRRAVRAMYLGRALRIILADTRRMSARLMSQG